MNRIVEARMRVTAEDRTGKTFTSVAGKMGRVSKTADALNRRTAAFGRSLDAVNTRAAVFHSRTSAMGRAAGYAAGEVGLLSARFLGPAAIAAGLTSATKAAASFEDALFGIQKKSGASAEEMERIKEQIIAVTRQLPVSREEVASAFERGAAAGIATDKLGEFAVLTNQVADAWDTTAENVGNTFAGFEKGLGIPLDKLEQYASLINDLADSGISDEVDIADFIDRAGASLRNFGLSAEEIAGYGAALINLKMPAEVAARAMDTLTGKLLAPENLSKKSMSALSAIVGDVKQFQKLAGNARLMYFFEQLEKLDSQKRASYLGGLLGEGFDDEVMRAVGGLNEIRRNQEMVRKHNDTPSESIAGVSEKKLTLFNSQLQILINNLNNVQSKVGEKITDPLGQVLAEVNKATDRQSAIDHALEKRGMSYWQSQWHQVGLSQRDQDMLAIEGGFNDPELRRRYEQGPVLPEDWKSETDLPDDRREGPHRLVKGKNGQWYNETPGMGPIPGVNLPATGLDDKAGRDRMTATMLARRAEIAYFNSEEGQRALKATRYARDGLTDDTFDNFHRRNGLETGREAEPLVDLPRVANAVGRGTRAFAGAALVSDGGDRRSYADRHAAMEPWTPTRVFEGIKDFFNPQEAEPVGEALAQAAISRMSSDAGTVGNELGSVVREAIMAASPQIGAAIAQAFAAGASQVKIGVNTGGFGGPGGKLVNADVGRTMPGSDGRSANIGPK